MFDSLRDCSAENKGGNNMAISALPVDGLINRLIQQHQLPAAKTKASPAQRPFPEDQVSISSQAQTQADAEVAQHGSSKLENQLLQMYSARSGSGK